MANEYTTKSNFSIQVEGAPEFSDAVARFNLPSVTNNAIKQSNGWRDIPVSGTHVKFSDLNITVHLDENFDLYNLLYEWSLNNSGEEDHRTLTLLIYSTDGKPKRRFIFQDAFPTNLGEIEFDSTDQTDTLLQMQATFSFSVFSISNS